MPLDARQDEVRAGDRPAGAVDRGRPDGDVVARDRVGAEELLARVDLARDRDVEAGLVRAADDADGAPRRVWIERVRRLRLSPVDLRAGRRDDASLRIGAIEAE